MTDQEIGAVIFFAIVLIFGAVPIGLLLHRTGVNFFAAWVWILTGKHVERKSKKNSPKTPRQL